MSICACLVPVASEIYAGSKANILETGFVTKLGCGSAVGSGGGSPLGGDSGGGVPTAARALPNPLLSCGSDVHPQLGSGVACTPSLALSPSIGAEFSTFTVESPGLA